MAYMVAQASERAIDVATCPVCTTPCATCKPESCSCACLFRVKRRSMGHSCVPHIQHIHVSKSCAANKDVAVICQPSFTHTSLSHVHPASPYRRWLRINEQTCSSGTVSFQYLLQCMSSPEPAGHNMLARPTRIGRWEIAIFGVFPTDFCPPRRKCCPLRRLLGYVQADQGRQGQVDGRGGCKSRVFFFAGVFFDRF